VKIASLIIIVLMLFFTGCGSATSSQNSGSGDNSNSGSSSKKAVFTPQEIDTKVSSKFGDDNSTEVVSGDAKALVGNWYGENKRFKVYLQLKKDGTYNYISRLGLGKFYNIFRTTQYNGVWELKNSNSQIVLSLQDCDAPLILSNRFPIIKAPMGIDLVAGSEIDSNYAMQIDESKDVVVASYTTHAQEYMQREVNDFNVDYFTMVAPKVNSEAFWDDLKPMGYHYGHKMGVDTPEWKYATQRIKDDPNNYIFAIVDESWQTLIGHRKDYVSDVSKPEKIYKWLEFWKAQMKLLGKVEGTVLYFIAGDAPPFWAGNIRGNFNNDPKNVPAKITQSRFPEALERNPSQSFAGIFQMMDYLRMKYAPNVKLGYTLKTWGIAASRHLYTKPQNGWQNEQDMQVMADYLNNYDVKFDILCFNFNPKGTGYTDEQYKVGIDYFGTISKNMHTRDNQPVKLWVWKVSLWSEHPSFYFRNIDFMVNEANAIGMTLGHGNDLVGQSGFSDNEKQEIYIRSWMHEYYNNETNTTLSKHATKGLVYWR
jgi:hypothetical protein